MLQFIRMGKIPKNKPLLVGLPGLGLVGKIAVDYLINEHTSQKIAVIYSSSFPPQVIMVPGEAVDTMHAELYRVKLGRRVFNVLTGNVQPSTPDGHFEFTMGVLDYVEPKEVITLGGYRVGKLKEQPDVFGAALPGMDTKRFERAGAIFGKVQGNIFGAAGMFLTGAEIYNIPAVCLMAETHGTFVDPLGARAVLNVLSRLYNLKLDLSKLEKEGEISKNLAKGIEEQVKKLVSGAKRESDESYIR